MKTVPKGDNLELLSRDYTDYLMAVRRLSLHTVAAYTRDLKVFTDFIKSEELDFPPDRRAARAFVSSLNRKGLDKRSVNRNLAAVRGFFRYLRKRELVTADPFEEIENLKEGRRIPSFLRTEELEAMLDLSGTDFSSRRNQLILELLYSTGCRVSEASGIRLDDIDLRAGRIRVMGKGAKERFVYLGEPARQSVRDYMGLRKAVLSGLGKLNVEKSLFVNKQGGALSDRSIRNIVKAAAAGAGVARKVSPHTLRHSFATHLVEGGAGIRSVQELLGHSSLRATQVYTHAELDRLRKVHAGAHPHGSSAGPDKKDAGKDD